MLDPRPLIVEVCHLLAARTFTTATGGNVSARLPDDTAWVTPSRLHKARVTAEDLVRVTLDGTPVEGARSASSETPMHLAMYRALPEAGAIIHAHPPAATGFAQANRAIDTRSSSEATVILGPEVPLIPYARPSTDALATLVGASMRPDRRAYLMAQHGVLTWGADLWDAYDILDTLEIFTMSLLVSTLIGGAAPLPPEELAWLARKVGG
ncbi:MAG TPA: class II aldolase/adducin family protein [Armatimonadota bacterium]|nr:class II aldolase/adducin family protein [Armatimonadota bacterium]